MADCDEVAARMNANMKAYRERLHARGLCIRCRNSLELERAGYLLCEACAAKQNAVALARTKRLKEEGRCIWCGRRAVDGATMCRACKIKNAARMARWRKGRK